MLPASVPPGRSWRHPGSGTASTTSDERRSERRFLLNRRLDVRPYDLVTAPVIPAAEWAWRRQSIWSQTAGKLKAGPHRLWGIRMGLTAVTAALALAGSQVKTVSLPASIALAVAAALSMAAVALLRGQQNVEQVRYWTRARSVSEAIKTEVFLFLSQSGSYDGPDRERRLEAEVQRLEHEVGDLQRYTDGVRAKDRSLPAVHDVASYLDVRVRQSQLEGYYEPKARLMRQRLRALKAVEVTLALVAAALAAVAAIWPSVGAWAAVVTLRGERWQRTSPRNVMSSCGSSTAAPLASFAVSMIGARQRMAVPFLVQNSSPSANKSSRCRTRPGWPSGARRKTPPSSANRNLGFIWQRP